MVDIRTARLRVRDPAPRDLEGWHRLFSDAQNLRFVEHMRTHTLEESRARLRQAIESARESARARWFYAVELAQTGAFAGSIGFMTEPIGGGVLGGIGWFLLPEHQGKGYATEAFQALIPRMFRDWGVTLIDASCDAANRASARVMQKGGMALVWQYDGRLQYQLAKEDWEKSQQE